jgi:hypothetical protein
VNRPQSRQKQSNDIFGFLTRALVLLALIGAAVWAGWFAPWSRADVRVKVEAVDKPSSPAPSP